MLARSLAAALVTVVAVVAELAAAGCGAPTVQGSGNVVTKSLPAPGPFSAVRGEGAMELTLVQGPSAGLTVEADDNLQELVRTETKDGSLRIWTDGSWTSKSTLKVTVTAPTFSGVAAAGAVRAKAGLIVGGPGVVLLSANGTSQIDVDEVQGPGLKISALGATRVSVGKSAPETVEVWASGTSKVLLHATCTKATVRAEGAATVGDANFKTKTADVMVTGTSSVDMDIAVKLQADATGHASITYGGDPEVKGVSGAATWVEKRTTEKP